MNIAYADRTTVVREGDDKHGANLARQATRAGAATVLSHGVSFCVHIVSTIVLARLLTPRDFGLVAMVQSFTLLFLNFGLNGFTEAIIQREKISNDEISKVFWLNGKVTLALTCSFMVGAPAVAWFYKEPELKWICLAMSLSIVLTGLGTVHLAILKRNLQFGVLSAAFVSARVSGLIASVLFAWLGGGYWALVLGVSVSAVSLSASAWMMCHWRPTIGTGDTSISGIVRFALNTYGNFATSYVSRNLDNLLVGWSFGSVALGNYKKAYDLFALPVAQLTAPLTSVAVASLSRLQRHPCQFRKYYLQAIQLVAFAGMGLSGLLTLVGGDFLRLLLGPQWDEAARIFAYFAPAVGIMLLNTTNGWLHLSLGRSDRWFRWGIIEMVVSALAFGLALPFGPTGVAVAWGLSAFVLCTFGVSYAGRPVGLSLVAVLRAIWVYVAASFMATTACIIVRGFTVPELDAVSQFLITPLSFSLMYALPVLGFRTTRAPLFAAGRLLLRRSAGIGGSKT